MFFFAHKVRLCEQMHKPLQNKPPQKETPTKNTPGAAIFKFLKVKSDQI